FTSWPFASLIGRPSLSRLVTVTFLGVGSGAASMLRQPMRVLLPFERHPGGAGNAVRNTVAQGNRIIVIEIDAGDLEAEATGDGPVQLPGNIGDLVIGIGTRLFETGHGYPFPRDGWMVFDGAGQVSSCCRP